MRDEHGVYLGEDNCLHWSGVERYQEAECCGGRKFAEAVLRCAVHGTVKSCVCTRRTCDEMVRKDPRRI